MIETIYRMENEESKKPDISIRLPKNIKQIGQSDGAASCQIYIEENVMSYIKQPPREDKQVKYGVFLGDIKKGNGYTYVFINGIIEVEEVIESTIIFSEEVWTSIYDNIKRYYKEGMVVGWYGSFESSDVIDMQRIRKVHLDHFAGNNKVFLCIDRQEDEEAFYIYERNGLMKQSCYHIYFEKSENFEDYLFTTGRQERTVQVRESRATRGKYGIALNNNVGGTDDKVKQVAKMNLGKVASWGTILALTGVIAAMALNGDLNALGDQFKRLADDIINPEDEGPDFDNIIPINGNNSTSNAGNELESVNSGQVSSENESESSEEPSSEEPSSEEPSSEEPSSEEPSSEEPSTEKPSTEEPSSENASTEKPSSSESPSEESPSEEETTPSSEDSKASSGNIEYKTYVVKKGDTLYSIAIDMYGDADKIREIVEINKLEDENYVMEGQKIFLP